MTAAMFQNPIFQDETKAREALEAVRWPDGPVCPHCGSADGEKIAKVEGKKQSHRPGLFYCNECKGQFTVTVGTVFERSKIPLTKWWMAAHLFNQGKNGVSAHEIHRTLGITYKTAWFMMHRLREAMRTTKFTPMGGKDKSVQADETYYGNTSKRAKHYKKGHSQKASVVALVEPHTSKKLFGVFKRGMRGTYMHYGEQHLQRYLNEFEFRYNNRSGLGITDGERTALAMKGIEGKRLTYRSAN